MSKSALPGETTSRPASRTSRRLGGTFLAGAGGRLLPASVPFRWFGAAVAFHVLAWAVLAASGAQWPQWHGGLGWPLAALHLVTLGTLVSSAIGASLQLLPVATRQGVRWPRLAALLWWAWLPGVSLLTLGMGLARPSWLAAGATVVLAVLLAWGVLLAFNLHGARGMPGVVLHGWGALAALGLLALSAASLVALWLGQPLLGRDGARALHLAAGVFGVMGLLVLGLSAILLPMFALAAVPDDRAQLTSGIGALAAVSLAALAALVPGGAPLLLGLRLAALATGALAFGLHLHQMRRVLKSGMRGELGRAGRMMRAGWAAALLALLLALIALGVEAGGGDGELPGRLFVLAAVGGWLLTFLFGVLQRILPFLASMHAARGQRRPPTPSALTLDRALAWHERCHLLALALLAAALAAGSGMLAALAGAVGLAGALAFGVFFVVLIRRLGHAQTKVAAEAPPATEPTIHPRP